MVATAPPKDLAKDILALGEWTFPPLEGIIQPPTLRPDGSVFSDPGYDPITRLYYIKPPNLFVPPIPENPTQEDIKDAVSLILRWSPISLLRIKQTEQIVLP